MPIYYYLDTSAMAKLYHVEAGTSYMDWLAARPEVRLVASPIAFVEFESVAALKERSKQSSAEEAEKARRRMRADVASGLIRGTGPLTEQHLGTADGSFADLVSMRVCERSTRFTSQWLKS